MSNLTEDEKFGLILQSIGKLEDSINSLRTDVSEMKVSVEQLIQTQANQSEILKRQNDIIELLSARSIAHESQLNKGSLRKKDIS